MSKHNIRNHRFKQEQLKSDLSRVVAGQSSLSRLVLVTCIFLACFFINILTGYLAGLSGLFITINVLRIEFILVLVAVIIWLAIVPERGLNQSLTIVTLLSCTILVILAILIQGNFLGLLPETLIRGFLAIIVGLGIVIANFFVIRLGSATLDILSRNTRFLKLLVLCSITIAAILGSEIAWNVMVSLQDEMFQRAFRSASNSERSIAEISRFVCAIGLNIIIFISALWTNWRQKVPWNHLDPLRDWALTVGCWGGTSFHNLDLSNINFRGAQLANTDLRAKVLYRTCFQDVMGLNRARVDNHYLDLPIPKVQTLLTSGNSQDKNFRRLHLQGAYLKTATMEGFDFSYTDLTGADLEETKLRDSVLVCARLAGVNLQRADLRDCNLTDTNLTQADCRDADLRDTILVRAQVARVDFTGAKLTGICIEDWSVSYQTNFSGVRCDYIYRKYQDGQPCDRYPRDRNFEPGEFACLFQQLERIVELVFKGEFDYNALSLAVYKLQTEAPELEIELKGIEQREKLWVVKVRSNGQVTERLIEEKLSLNHRGISNETSVEVIIKRSIYQDYEETKNRLAASEQLVRQLAGISDRQAEALKELSKRALGNSFFINGSTITNLAGSGQIEYNEAVAQIRRVVTSNDSSQMASLLQNFINQLNGQNVATQDSTQMELIQQLILAEAQQDQEFKQFLIEQEQQIVNAMLPEKLATTFQSAIAQLKQ